MGLIGNSQVAGSTTLCAVNRIFIMICCVHGFSSVERRVVKDDNVVVIANVY